MDPVSDAQRKFARNMLGPRPGANKKANDQRRKKMSLAERQTGMTAERLEAHQQKLRRDYEERAR